MTMDHQFGAVDAHGCRMQTAGADMPVPAAPLAPSWT